MKKSEYTIALLGLVADHKRRIKDGSQYDTYFPPASNDETILNPNGSVAETIEFMEEIVHDTLEDTAKIAPLLKGKNFTHSLQNIWNFIYNHIQYKLDRDGVEELRRPRRTWHDRATGVDCDCMSIFTSSILTNLGIDHKFRVTRYDANWQHVYVIIPLPDNRKKYYVADCVLNQFNEEKTYSDKIDHTMNTNTLNGIPIAMLGAIDAASDAATHAIEDTRAVFEGTAFGNMDEHMDGLGVHPAQLNDSPLLKSIYDYLVTTRDAIRKNPASVGKAEAESHLKMLNYAIAKWDTSEREAALDILEKEESRWNEIAEREQQAANEKVGISGTDEFSIHERHDLSAVMNDDYSLSGIGDVEELLGGLGTLGSSAKRKTFFSNIKNSVQAIKKINGAILKKVESGAKGAAEKIKNAAKKVGKLIKEVLIKTNPLLILARVGLNVAMRVNLFQIASHLYPGYFTKEQAASMGVNEQGWTKAKENISKVAKILTDIGGHPDKLKKAVTEGRAHKKYKKVSLTGLGEPVEAGAAAAVIAAVPVVTKVANSVSKVQQAGQTAKDAADNIDKVDQSTSGIQGFIQKIKGWFQQKKQDGDNFNDVDVNKEKASEQSADSTTDASATSNDAANDALVKAADDAANGNSGSGLVSWAKANPGTVATIVVASAAGISLCFPKVRQKIGLARKAPTKVAMGSVGAAKKHKARAAPPPKKKRVKSITLK